jgi:hypothetical protein
MNLISVIKTCVLTGILFPGITLSFVQDAFSQEEITWTESAAEHRGQNGKRVTYRCPTIIGIPELFVWGTDVYTDDSPVCLAAVHAGIITTQGGVVTIEIRPGQASYTGSTRNGVTTQDFGVWPGSYVFIPPTPPAPSTPATPTTPTTQDPSCPCATVTPPPQQAS